MLSSVFSFERLRANPHCRETFPRCKVFIVPPFRVICNSFIDNFSVIPELVVIRTPSHFVFLIILFYVDLFKRFAVYF
jgi:hypothetical protein